MPFFESNKRMLLICLRILFAHQQLRDLQKLNQSIRSLFQKQIEDVLPVHDMLSVLL